MYKTLKIDLSVIFSVFILKPPVKGGFFYFQPCFAKAKPPNKKNYSHTLITLNTNIWKKIKQKKKKVF